MSEPRHVMQGEEQRETGRSVALTAEERLASRVAQALVYMYLFYVGSESLAFCAELDRYCIVRGLPRAPPTLGHSLGPR